MLKANILVKKTSQQNKSQAASKYPASAPYSKKSAGSIVRYEMVNLRNRWERKEQLWFYSQRKVEYDLYYLGCIRIPCCFLRVIPVFLECWILFFYSRVGSRCSLPFSAATQIGIFFELYGLFTWIFSW